MIHSAILQKVQEEVRRIFREELSSLFVYHNLAHTQSVVYKSDSFACHYNLSPSEREILAIAAWFHDVGYAKGYEEHEKSSERMARRFLQQLSFPKSKIEKVAHCIQATKVETQPNNLIEKIIKDADLANLGEDSFLDHSRRLRLEWFTLLGEEYSDTEWNILNRDFLEQHQYFTSIAKKELGSKKAQHLQMVKSTLTKEKR